MHALKPVEPKAPTESKLYTMDWSGALNPGATISTSSWGLAPSDLTNVSDAIVSGSLKTTIKLSGGADGTEYECTNTITTSDGETLVRTGLVLVQRR